MRRSQVKVSLLMLGMGMKTGEGLSLRVLIPKDPISLFTCISFHNWIFSSHRSCLVSPLGDDEISQAHHDNHPHPSHHQALSLSLPCLNQFIPHPSFP